MDERRYDVVVFGATGFTGGLVSEYLARRRDPGLRWAIAGRSPAKLSALRARLEKLSPGGEIGTLEASVDDPESLERMAAQGRVVLTTVGPYARHGEPVVRACIAAGTDYADITGEPAFVHRMVERCDAPARERGVRIVNCCGFDSVPADLGAWLAVHQLGGDAPIRLEGFVKASGTFSGGTWHSALEALADVRVQRAEMARRLRVRETEDGRLVGAEATSIRREPELDAWVAPMPTIDPEIVVRSARALPEYGPDFRYGHYVVAGSLPRLALGAVGVGALVGLAQVGPTRRLLLRLRSPGQGPSEAQRARGAFTVVFLGTSGDRRVQVEVRGGDPGYGETSKMAAESALCLARDRDRLPERAGVLTPAAAMAERLLERLRAAGIAFDVVA